MIEYIHTPQKIGDNHVTFLLRLEHCPTCNQDMVVKPEDNCETFPYHFDNDFDAQAKRARLVLRSEVKVDNIYICLECEQAGKATFFCELCKERKSTAKKKSSYGDPPVFLCLDCYETTPAKIWVEKDDELHHAHRYDW